MNAFEVHIFAADRVLYEGPCESVVVPTVRGLYGILAHHAHMISAVVPGALSFRVPGGQTQLVAVSSGMVKVENNDVLVIVDSAERPEDIDELRARRAADEAKEELLQKRSIREYRSAQAYLARALTRLKVKSSVNQK